MAIRICSCEQSCSYLLSIFLLDFFLLKIVLEKLILCHVIIKVLFSLIFTYVVFVYCVFVYGVFKNGSVSAFRKKIEYHVLVFMKNDCGIFSCTFFFSDSVNPMMQANCECEQWLMNYKFRGNSPERISKNLNPFPWYLNT